MLDDPLAPFPSRRPKLIEQKVEPPI